MCVREINRERNREKERQRQRQREKEREREVDRWLAPPHILLKRSGSQGYIAHKKSPSPPQVHRMLLGIVLL